MNDSDELFLPLDDSLNNTSHSLYNYLKQMNDLIDKKLVNVKLNLLQINNKVEDLSLKYTDLATI